MAATVVARPMPAEARIGGLWVDRALWRPLRNAMVPGGELEGVHPVELGGRGALHVELASAEALGRLLGAAFAALELSHERGVAVARGLWGGDAERLFHAVCEYGVDAMIAKVKSERALFARLLRAENEVSGRHDAEEAHAGGG